MTFFSGGETQEERLAGMQAPGAVANQNMARRIKLIQDAAPMFGQGEGVKFATQLAQSAFSDEEVIKQATATASDVLIRAYKDGLTKVEDPWKQLQQWKQFDEGTQRLLKKSGYVPPVDAEPPEPGFFGTVAQVAGDVVGGTAGILGIKQALEGLDYLGSLGTHLYRTARLGAEEEGVFGIGGSLSEAEIQERRATPLAVWRDMKNLWSRTSEGEKNFSLKSQERVRKAMGGDADKFEFVTALAEGRTASDYIEKDLGINPEAPLFEQQLMKYNQYQQDDRIMDAVKDLRNNKVSPGRDLAEVVTPFRRGTAPFNVISGGVDATFRILTDPTLAAGKVAKGVRLSKYGLESSMLAGAAGGVVEDAARLSLRVDQLREVPRFRRAADTIVEGLNTGQGSRLLDQLPQLRGGGLHDMTEYFGKNGIKLTEVTSDHVFDYFKSTAGAAALREGKFAAPHFPGTILPSATRAEQVKTGISLGAKDWVGQFRLEDYGFDALTKEQMTELFGLKTRTKIALQSAVGDAIHSFYTQVPKVQYMGADDSQSLNQFRAVLDYSLPGHLRDDFVNDFMSTTDVAGKRAIYESGVQAMFHYSGALQTEEGRRLMGRVLGRTQHYATDGVDVLRGRSVGIGEADIAEFWGVPDFKEMLKATAETTKYRKWLDSTNEGLINRFFSNYWKPAVLLKAGFIPRAYGEEYLGFILREGPTAWVKGQAAITATKEGYLAPLRPVGWIADSLLSHIPLTYRNNTIDIYAHNFADSASQYVRDWAGKLAPDEYVAAARSLAEYGGGIDGATSMLGVSYGEVSTPVAQRIKNEVIGRVDQNTGEIVDVPIRHGEFTTHVKGSGFHASSVLREMRRMQSDRLFAPLIDAGRRQIGLEDGERISGLFREMGLIGERGAGLSYVQDLRKMRELVPDEVMPNFEKWLRHDSHASIQSVLDDLTGAGMELEDARDLRNAIEALDTRERVAIFTRNGEIENIYRPHILDPDAAFDVDSQLPIIRQGVEDEARREYNEVLEELWSPSDSTNAYWKISRRRLNSADMSETVRKSYRSRTTLDGRSVAAPPAKGTRRVYTVLMDKDPVSAFEDLGHQAPVSSTMGMSAGPNAAPKMARQGELMSGLDDANGYIPFQSAEINGLIPDHQPNMTIIEDLPEGEVLTPEEMAWFTADFAHAEDIRNGLQTKYKTQTVSVGYVDVPEDVFQQGQRRAKENIAGGLDPLAQANASNQVWIPKSWRENYQVLSEDNYQLINGVPAVGASRSEALDDWASVIGMRYKQVFEHTDNLSLRELQHRLYENRINVRDIVDNGQYLNDAAIGPAILEPERENWFKRVVTNGFEVVGKGGNAMIRNQMYLHYYAQRLAEETTVMARLLGNTGATEAIERYAERLGTKHYKLVSDWKALPEEARNAVNPVEYMIANDVIPPSLRTVVDVEDQRMFAEAFTAFYEHDNPDLLKAAQKVWTDKYVKQLGVEGYSFRDIQDSYISLDADLRHSILDNGYPPQFPDSFAPKRVEYEPGSLEAEAAKDLPPQFTHTASQLSADEWTELRDALNTNRHIYGTAHRKAMTGAINDTIPWIDDHRVRSQFQQHGRNLIPFWFAQENFIKRVANNVWRDPASIRKAQIAMDALHNSGVVTQNQYGEDVFNIPLTGTLTKAVTKMVEVMPGDFKLYFPVVSPMTGQLKYTIPGLDSFDRIGPSVSPLAALPLQAVAKVFPELEAAKRAIIGERGVTDTNPFDAILKSIMPSWAHKMYESFAKDIGSDSEYASAMIQTAQMLEASGHGPVSNPDEYDYDDYLSRLENFTRMQMFLRGAVGFFSPAAPSTNPVEEFSPEFRKLLDQMPLEEAFMQFMAENPNAQSYTIVKTDVPSKAPLSTSEEAGKMLEDYEDFFSKHKMAAPWLLPQSNDDTGFSDRTYNLQMARELRKRKSIKEWYDDYYFASAAESYFNSKERYDLQMAAAKGNPQIRQQLTESYKTWKDDYLKQNKVFARLLVDPTAQQRRREVLDTIVDALDDPDGPEVAHKDQLRTVATSYQRYLDTKSQYIRNTNVERQIKQNMTDDFTMWVKQYVDRNPSVKAFYTRIIRPELGIED